VETRVNIETYSSKLEAEIASLVIETRRFVLDLVPEAIERYKWSHPWYEYNGSFCYIMGFSKHINLGFPRGAELVDRFSFLEGTGKGMRHVKIRSTEDLQDPDIAKLVMASVELNSSSE
jgi:hypothetical protein